MRVDWTTVAQKFGLISVLTVSEQKPWSRPSSQTQPFSSASFFYQSLHITSCEQVTAGAECSDVFHCCSATWVMWWVAPVRNPAWAIFNLCSPELDCRTAGLLAAAAASVFVSPLLSNTSRIQQGPTGLTSMNTLDQRGQDDYSKSRKQVKKSRRSLHWNLRHFIFSLLFVLETVTWRTQIANKSDLISRMKEWKHLHHVIYVCGWVTQCYVCQQAHCFLAAILAPQTLSQQDNSGERLLFQNQPFPKRKS